MYIYIYQSAGRRERIMFIIICTHYYFHYYYYYCYYCYYSYTIGQAPLKATMIAINTNNNSYNSTIVILY